MSNKRSIGRMMRGLTEHRRRGFSLTAVADRAGIPGGVGEVAEADQSGSSTGGGGLSEPFTFVSSTTRTETLATACGSIDVEVITAVTLTDANGVEFSIPFEAPA